MNIAEVEQYLDAEFAGFAYGASKFPNLFRTGVADAAVHAAGVSYVLSLGLDYGLPAIAEYPITVHAEPRWKRLGRIFPDSVWFHPQTLLPWVCCEFERFERGDENKIREKVENLALSFYQAGGHVELCVFLYWLRSGLAPRTIDPLRAIFRSGFRRSGIKVDPPTCRLLVYKLVFCEAKAHQATSRGQPIMEPSGGYGEAAAEPHHLVLREARKMHLERP